MSHKKQGTFYANFSKKMVNPEEEWWISEHLKQILDRQSGSCGAIYSLSRTESLIQGSSWLLIVIPHQKQKFWASALFYGWAPLQTKKERKKESSQSAQPALFFITELLSARNRYRSNFYIQKEEVLIYIQDRYHLLLIENVVLPPSSWLFLQPHADCFTSSSKLHSYTSPCKCLRTF